MKSSISVGRLTLFLTVVLTVVVAMATLYGLDEFAALPNSGGVLTDWRSTVLLEIRYPRLVLAMLAGAVLAIAGQAMQGLLQNPLASPGLLGSSAGATTASVFLLYYFSAPVVWLLGGGVLGALASFLLVYGMARRHSSTVMILAGVAVNALLAAMVALLLSNARSPWALAELYRWLQGSLALAQWQPILWSLPVVFAGIGLILSQRRYCDFLSFGEATAMTMGINPKRAFLLTALGIALCIGAIIPQTGVIGFIGLIAPHVARLLAGGRPSRLYGVCALLGALLLVCADLLVWRIPLFERVYIGTLTAMIGAPCLVWILLTQRQVQRHD